MAISNILRAFTCYVDGFGKLGSGEELALPKLQEKNEEFRGGAMQTPIEVSLGTEKLEAEIMMNNIDEKVIGLWGIRQGSDKPFTFRGHLQGEDGVSKKAIVTMRGRIKETDFDNWKAGEKAGVKFMLAIKYYKLEIEGEEIVEIDALNLVHRIKGEDQLEGVKDSLGVIGA